MANIASGIAAVLLALSAFYAYKNKGAVESLENDIVAVGAKADLIQGKLEVAQSDNATTQDELVAVQSDTESLNTELAETQAQDEQLTTSIADKKEQTKANEAKIGKSRDVLDSAGNVDDLLRNVNGFEEDLATLQNEIANNQAKLSLLQKSIADKQAQLADLRTRKDSTSKFRSIETLNTTIRVAINRHGFVILNGGDSAGIVANSPLEVVRGGEVIAKLKVDTVESNSASASIVPDSLAEGVSLRSGDRVISSAPDAQPVANAS